MSTVTPVGRSFGFRSGPTAPSGAVTGSLRDFGGRAIETVGGTALVYRTDREGDSAGVIVFSNRDRRDVPTGSDLVLPDFPAADDWASSGWPGFADIEAAIQSSGPAIDTDDIVAQLAADVPWVAMPEPKVPAATGDILQDVRLVCGLTYADIAVATGRREPRTVQYWPTKGIPEASVGTLESILAIGGYLVGGLGPKGTQTWFRSGNPSRLQRIAAGDIHSVAQEARSFEDTVAT